MMRFLILLTILQLSAYAGNKVGNGGDGVRCPKSANLTLLDFYENDRAKRFTIKYKDPDDEYAFAKKMLLEYERLDKRSAQKFMKVFDSLRARSIFLKNTVLTNIEDSNQLGLGKGCTLVQLAIRKRDVLTGKDQFHFSKNDWELLDTFNKAGLLIHEVIYEYFKLLGESDSQKARVFTSYLFSEEMKKHSAKEYQAMVRSLKISLY